MGHEIVYCSRCQIQLRAADFEKGSAFRLENQVTCSKCLPEEMREVARAAAAPREAAPPPKSGTARIPLAGPAPRTFRRRTSKGGWAGGLVGGGALVLLLLWIAGGASAPSRKPPPPEADPRKETVSIPPPSETAPAPPEPAPAPAPRTPSREELARKSVEEARGFAKTRPRDLSGQIDAFERAVRETQGTGFHEEVRKELDALRTREREAWAAELSGLDAQVQDDISREAYSRALKILEEARTRAPSGRTEAVDERLGKVRSQADLAYRPLKEKAVAARLRGAAEEVQTIRDRIAKWGLAELLRDFEGAVAPPPAPVAKEPDPRLAAWRGAVSLAGARDYPAAEAELRRLAESAKDPELRAETLADLEEVRRVAAVVQAVREALGKVPRGQKLSLEVFNESGARERAEGTVVRSDAHRIELKDESRGGVIEYGQLTARSIAELARTLLSRTAPPPAKTLDLLLLLEGDEGEAAVPDRFRAYASRMAEERSRVDPREAEARRHFALAARLYEDFSTQVEATQHYAALLKEFGNTAVVRRNRPSIAVRTEGGRDFVFLAEDLQPGGAFVRARGDKGEGVWLSEAEGPSVRMKDHYVELSFSVFAGTAYQGWAYVGGCCAETLAFGLQATGLTGVPAGAKEPAPIEPGGDAWLPVKHGLVTLNRSHAGHGGPRKPTRWGWVAIPLPAYSAAGPQNVRLVTERSGFAVAYAVVSSTRKDPPRENEMKDVVRERGETPGTPAAGRAEASLVAYWKFDEGSGTAARDATVLGHTAELAPGAKWAPGWKGTALSLDGANGRALVRPSPRLNNLTTFTYAAWVHPRSMGERRFGVIVNKGGPGGKGSKRFLLNDGVKGGVEFTLNRATQDSHVMAAAGTVTLNAWQHLALTYSPSGAIRMFKDGREVSYNAPPKAGAGAYEDESALELSIGAWPGGSGTFNGLLDEIRIYSRALTPAEVAALHALR